MNSRKINSGFTLIELLAAMAVLAVISSIAVPSFKEMITENRMDTQVKQLSSFVSLARSESTKNPNAFITLCSSSDNTACSGSAQWENGWIMFLDGNGDGSLNGTDQVLRVTGKMPDGSMLRIAGFASPSSTSIVQFSRNGQPLLASATTAQAGTFVVCDERGAKFARAIVVMVSGQMRLARDVGDTGIVNDHAGNDVSCP